VLSSEIKSRKNKAEPTKIGPIFIYDIFIIVMRDYGPERGLLCTPFMATSISSF
jgi:hypothetical protein